MDCVNGLTSWLDCFDTTFHTMSETFCHFLAETKVLTCTSDTIPVIMLIDATGMPQNRLCKYPGPPFSAIRYKMEIIGKIIVINPNTKLTMTNLSYF